MNITSVEVFRATPNCGADAQDAAHATESLLVRVASEQHEGWGAVVVPAAPLENSVWAGGEFAFLCECLAPSLVSEPVEGGETGEPFARFQDHAAAKFAVDQAQQRLAAAARSVSLCDLLQVEPAPQPLAWALQIEAWLDPSELMRRLEAANNAGCQVVVIRIRPGRDNDLLRSVRHVFPDQPLAVDADGSFDMNDLPVFYRMQDFQLQWIEQPFAADDLVAHAMLQEKITTPICLDQSITSRRRAEMAIDVAAGKIANVRPDRIGDLESTLAVAREQKDAGYRVHCRLDGRSPLADEVAECLARTQVFEALVAREGPLPEEREPPADSAPQIRLEGDELQVTRFGQTRSHRITHRRLLRV